MYPAFFGLSGSSLTPDEFAFFTEVPPAGFILFARNIDSREQVRALTDSLRELSGRDDVPILIDQEGGRVARLKPPLVPEFPAALRFGELFRRDVTAAIEATRSNAEAIALELHTLGINVNCLPVLDVPVAGAHDIIGDRAFGRQPDMVAVLGRAVIEGLKAGGVVSVIKHIPGHGRAASDSHLDLSVVYATADELIQDIAPFAALKDAPMAMTAHVIYAAFDRDRCATLSPIVIQDIIRSRIGFEGLLMSDDLGMKALTGSFAERAAGSIAAGCDIALHCSGDFQEMQDVAKGLSPISTLARARLDRAMASVNKRPTANLALLLGRRDELLAMA
jgi:beta-N-acetylhexosaminidase